jgi:Ni,Fe-hydrogenase I small subunit
METLLYLLYQAAGHAPMIPLDDCLRPRWLFQQTVHETCDRGGYYEQADFDEQYGRPKCIVKLGCWGPVVRCNVGKRGWMGGVGGCPNVGGICIGCTMPGFPDKFMPFMDEPPGAKMSSSAVMMYGRAVTALPKKRSWAKGPCPKSDLSLESVSASFFPRKDPETGSLTPWYRSSIFLVITRPPSHPPRPKKA